MQHSHNGTLTAQQRMLLGLVTVSAVLPVNDQAVEMQNKLEVEERKARQQEAKSNQAKMFHQQPKHGQNHKQYQKHDIGSSRKPR